MDVACGMQQWIASSPGFHGEIGLAINGGAACSDDFADISWFQALFLEYVGLFDVGVGGGDFPSSCFAAVGGGDGHAGFGSWTKAEMMVTIAWAMAPPRSSPGRWRCRLAENGT